MTTNTFDQRLQEAAQIRRDYRIELLTIGVIAGFIGGWFLFGANRPLANDGYITNVFTELLSVGLTVFVITEVVKRREITETKKRLIRQAGSVNHQIAINAVEEIRNEGLLIGENGILRGAQMSSAKLTDALLVEANLRGAYLHKANLNGANLQAADLRSAGLPDADVQKARLQYANLEGATCLRTRFTNSVLMSANLHSAYLRQSYLNNTNARDVNFSNADLGFSNLSGGDFSNANFENANLQSTDFSEASLVDANLQHAEIKSVVWSDNTILPDAEFSGRDEHFKPVYSRYWTPVTDMTRYTDSNHPDFWQPKWAAAGFESYREWVDAGKPKPGGDESGE